MTFQDSIEISRAEYTKGVLSQLRVLECVRMLAPGICGYLITFNEISSRHVIFFAAYFFHLLFVYTHNDFADFCFDSQNPRKALEDRGSQESLCKLTITFFSISLVLFTSQPLSVCLLFLALSIICFIYSQFRVRIFGWFPYGQFAHFLCGAGYFFSGTIIGDAVWEPRFTLAAFFFGFIYFSGGLMNELTDFRADRLAGLSTAPMVFGLRRSYGFLIVSQMAALTCLTLFYLPEVASLLSLVALFFYFKRCFLTQPSEEKSLSEFRCWYRRFFPIVLLGTVAIFVLF